ncbi:MAG: cobalamin-dependent protein [Pseudomonadota bacterium]
MPESTSQRSSFSQEHYEKTAEGMASLFSRLPETDVKTVAEEALKRIAERGEDVPAPATFTPSAQEVERLCLALMSDDPTAGASLIEEITDGGATLEEVYLKYLAPAARQFGERWEVDQASFFQVTVGIGRIFAILRALNSTSQFALLPNSRSALFAAVPGETHLLGIRMAADLFRQKGWDIELALDLSHDALLEYVTRSGHRVIGLSAAGPHSAPALARLIIALRLQDPGCFILVSGQILLEANDLVAATMPDGVANDIETAEALLESACAP